MNEVGFECRGDLGDRQNQLLEPGVQKLLIQLQHKLWNERQDLLNARQVRQAQWDQGETPDFIKDHPAQIEDWQVTPLPKDCLRRRVEITGPINSTKMVINMLNAGADGTVADMAMLDFEDSMAPTWSNVIDGVYNAIGAAKKDLRFEQIQNGETKQYQLQPENMAHPMVRVRGLHMLEENVIIDEQAVSASLFDLAVCAYHTAKIYLDRGETPIFYIPKCEHFLEARWWNQALGLIEESLNIEPGRLRITALIETLPAVFQIEEILYEFRERALGLNGGRWDKIFSDIKVLKNHKDRILADRSDIDMTKPWMDNYAKRIIKICHKHGAFAMGGMSAFTPGKDEATRKAQMQKVREDKARESQIGHDGCWVSHPYFIKMAKEQFQKDNQLDVQLPDFPDQPEILPRATGPKTIEGLRKNVRVGIAYLQGYLNGLGCVAFDNMMEDLATLEISRAQTWQWLHHKVSLDNGEVVTQDLVQKLFTEERERIINELNLIVGEEAYESYMEAAKVAERIFTLSTLENFIEDALRHVQ